MKRFGGVLLVGILSLTLACGSRGGGDNKSGGGDGDQGAAGEGPRFGGSNQKTFTSASNKFLVEGDCSDNLPLQYSYDDATWSELSSGCQNKKFSLQISVLNEAQVYFRALLTAGPSPSARALVRLVRPATSASFEFVGAGTADQDLSLGMQSSIGLNFTQLRQEGPSLHVKSSLIDIIYSNIQ